MESDNSHAPELRDLMSAGRAIVGAIVNIPCMVKDSERIPMRIPITILFAIFVAAIPAAQAQSPTTEAPPQRYLGDGDLTFGMILSAPPSTDTPIYAADDEVVLALQQVDDARYASALEDARLLYPRFASAFGRPIDRETSLTLVRLLDRAIADVNAVTFAAKDHYERPRPFQRLRLRRVCGMDNLPAPSPSPSGGASYPSGHTAWGWTTAMVLARIDPSRAEVLMARAAEYAESRIVCGVHYPTDISAAHTVAAAVVARLDGNAEFRADLERAREEAARR